MAAQAQAPPPAQLSVGLIVECRNPGEHYWVAGFVTSVEPLKVTTDLAKGPSATGFAIAEVRLLPDARRAELEAALAERKPPPPASQLSVGLIVERRNPGQTWSVGFVTSVEPLKVTATLAEGPSAVGLAMAEVRLLPDARRAELEAAVAAQKPPRRRPRSSRSG